MAAPSFPPAAQQHRNQKPPKRSHAAPESPAHYSHALPSGMSALPKGKRPRPSDSDVVSPPPAISRKPSSLLSRKSSARNGTSTTGKGDLYKKGMYLSFIQDAFDQRIKGNNERYNELVLQFKSLIPTASSSTATLSAEAPTTAQLRVWLEALTHTVSKLDETHSPLVETILALPWATMEDVFVSAYMRFIAALVSARPEWLKSVLDKCVKGFKYRSNYTIGSSASIATMTRRTVYSRLHSLLKMLFGLIPTLSPSLSPVLSRHFPSKRETRYAQVCYIDNLLSLSLYCPALTEDILGLIIDRALNIDVEIQGEPEEWEEVEEELIAAGQVDMTSFATVQQIVDRPTADDENSDSSDSDADDSETLLGDLDDDIESDDEPEPVDDVTAAKKAQQIGMSDEAIRKVLENRTKLDNILKLVFDHLATAHQIPAVQAPTLSAESFGLPPATPTEEKPASDSKESTPTPPDQIFTNSAERRLELFRALLDIFDRSLLRTFKTRNTQFILFYLCSLSASSSDHFIGVLLGRALFQSDAPNVTRVAAAGYLASFISRAKFVDANTTRRVVHHLCQFLEGQMEDFAASVALASHGKGIAASQDLPVFYAVAQAVFYIFCFRWKDLMDETDEDELVLDAGRRWMLGLETLKKAVGSNFNPLKVCAQPVVNQFASIANKTNFLYCYSILDANRKLATTNNSSKQQLMTRATAPAPPPRSASTISLPSAQPRQLLVAEEMDSFFPFDPFKLPLSAVYIQSIYREWQDDDASSASSTTEDSSEDSSDSDTETDSELETGNTAGGLAVPGLNVAGLGGDVSEDDQVARSFEAMSLSLSPQDESFGGRRKADQDRLPSLSSRSTVLV